MLHDQNFTKNLLFLLQGNGKLVFFDRVNFKKLREISVENTVIMLWNSWSHLNAYRDGIFNHVSGLGYTMPDFFSHRIGFDPFSPQSHEKSNRFHYSYVTLDCREPACDRSYTKPSHPAPRCPTFLSLTTVKLKWSGSTSNWCSYTIWNAERSESDWFLPLLHSGVVSFRENRVD